MIILYYTHQNIKLDPKNNLITKLIIRHMHSRYLPNLNLFLCGASHREVVRTIFKVFGMTRPLVD